jgi:hypothetical protein
VAPVSHADPEAVEPAGRGLPAGSAVRLLNLPAALIAKVGQVAIEVLDSASGRVVVEGAPDPFEQTRIALRPEEHSKEFAPHPGVVHQAPADLEESNPLPCPAGQRAVGEEAQRHVPVPDAADETSEPLEAAVVALQIGPGLFRKKAPPDRDPHAQTAEVPVQAVEGRGGGTLSGDQSVELVERGIETPLELLDELRDRGG